MYFNRKYLRSGHLFQARFYSDPIETDAQFMEVYRYILQNPDRAGIGTYLTYKWCSYKAFASKDSFIDSEMAAVLFGSKEVLDDFLKTEGVSPFYHPMDDNAAYHRACILLNMNDLTEISKWNGHDRDKALEKLKQYGFPERQISRLTGIGRAFIRNA